MHDTEHETRVAAELYKASENDMITLCQVGPLASVYPDYTVCLSPAFKPVLLSFRLTAPVPKSLYKEKSRDTMECSKWKRKGQQIIL